MSKSETIAGLVSTIVPVHNRPELVREAITSVLNQSHRPIEIIAVDDGSTDDTQAVLEALVNDYRGEVRLVRQQNGGPGAAREAGRQIARGEFVQYLDSDDLLLPRKFEIQVKGLRDAPHCKASYGKTRCYSHGDMPQNVPCKRTGERIETMFPSFLKSRWWSTSTPLFRREVIDRAGPWKALWNEEDWEYDCRIAAQGVLLHYCPEFVSDTRRGRDDQLCADGTVDPDKLTDRAEAHRLILESARRYGIGEEVPEMQHFSRELFLLSRQCGTAGLRDQSRMLFQLARDASPPSHRNRWDFQIYQLIASVLGWRNAASMARQLDNLRQARIARVSVKREKYQ